MNSKKRLIKNILSLSGINVANYIFPLLTIPYVTRIIGPEGYGKVNFIASIVAYFVLFVSYAHDYTVTREISRQRNNTQAINKIFTTTIYARLILLAFSTVCFLLLMIFVPKLQKEFLGFGIAYVSLIGIVIFPSWFLQGMENLTFISTMNFTLRFITTGLTFVVVTTKWDYINIIWLSTLSSVATGVWSFVYCIRKYAISFVNIKIVDIYNHLKEGNKLFLSYVFINLFTTTNIVILGLASNDHAVGIYSGAYKIYSIFQVLLLFPFSQAFYPHISQSFHENFDRGVEILKKVFILLGATTIVISIALFLFSDIIVRIILGNQFLDASIPLRIMSAVPFLSGMSNLFGIQGMLNLKMDKEFLIIMIIAAVISLTLNFALVIKYSFVGTSISWLITEAFITVSTFFVLSRRIPDLTNLKGISIMKEISRFRKNNV